jgi:hypothetical protein
MELLLGLEVLNKRPVGSHAPSLLPSPPPLLLNLPLPPPLLLVLVPAPDPSAAACNS